MHEKKNILFLHHVSSIGGAEGYLLSIFKNLEDRFNVYFVCQEPGPLTELMQGLDVKVSFFKMRAWRKFKFWLVNLFTVRKLVEYCKENDIHLICSNCYRVTPYAVKTARKLRIPTITIVQDFASYKKLKVFHTFNCDQLIAVSDSIKKNIESYFNKEISTIHNCINADEFSRTVDSARSVRGEFGIPDHKRIVGIVGSIVPLKQHKMFLDSAKLVLQDMKDVIFVVVGGSPDKKKLSLEDLKEHAASLGILDDVIFTGFRNDVPTLLNSFDILVHTSNREAFGRVLIEAMVLSVPIVATHCGGPSEIVLDEKSGYLVDKDSPNDVADRVKLLLKDEKKRKDMGQLGRERVKVVFNEYETVKKMNGVLCGLLN